MFLKRKKNVFSYLSEVCSFFFLTASDLFLKLLDEPKKSPFFSDLLKMTRSGIINSKMMSFLSHSACLLF